MSFMIPLSVGAAVLAVWADYRFENRRPASLTRRGIHVAAAWGLLQLTVVVCERLMPDQASDARRVVVLFCLFLPSLIYTFVTCLWLVRVLADVTSVSRR
jgi:hypothetical protein